MKLLANILWMILGGLVNSLLWALFGFLWCITIVGIPLGKQCFKFARLTLAPFGKEVSYEGSAASTVLNVLWIVVTGIPMAIENAVCGLTLCVSIIGIPLGLQYFKIAKLAFAPFGMEVK